VGLAGKVVARPKVLEHPYNPVDGTAKYELHAISVIDHRAGVLTLHHGHLSSAWFPQSTHPRSICCFCSVAQRSAFARITNRWDAKNSPARTRRASQPYDSP